MCRRHAFGIVRPRFWQIKPPVDEGMAVARYIGGEHADPASDSCRRAPCTGAQRRTTPRPVQKTGLVDDKNRVPICEHLYPRPIGRGPGPPVDAMGRDRPPPQRASSPSCGVRFPEARPETVPPTPLAMEQGTNPSLRIA